MVKCTWLDVPDSDRGDFRCRRAIDTSKFHEATALSIIKGECEEVACKMVIFFSALMCEQQSKRSHRLSAHLEYKMI